MVSKARLTTLKANAWLVAVCPLEDLLVALVASGCSTVVDILGTCSYKSAPCFIHHQALDHQIQTYCTLNTSIKAYDEEIDIFSGFVGPRHAAMGRFSWEPTRMRIYLDMRAPSLRQVQQISIARPASRLAAYSTSRRPNISSRTFLPPDTTYYDEEDATWHTYDKVPVPHGGSIMGDRR